ADAGRAQSVSGASALERMREVPRDARSRSGERVAERDGAPADIGPLAAQAELLFDRQVLGRECLVDLDELDRVEPKAGLLETAPDRGRGPDAHDLGIAAHRGPSGDTRERAAALALGHLPRADHERGGAVADARGVARGHDAPLLEDGR